jgi:hypothetical protein
MNVARKIGLLGTALFVFLAFPFTAFAYPLLQLDIEGGTYDSGTESIVTGNGSFTLYSILTPQNNPTQAEIDALLSETYYISVSITPSVDENFDSDLTFVFDGTTYNVTEDMIFGTAPIDAVQGHDAGDLPKHGVYPTFFIEVDFQFDSSDTAESYNTQDNPGGLDDSGSGSFYASFEVDSSLFGGDYFLHFDLYTTHSSEDVDIVYFAPFSHDAETVPEPNTLLLLGAGLVAASLIGRTRRLKNL